MKIDKMSAGMEAGAERDTLGTNDRPNHGLRPNALTFFDSIVMALAGTAPAFAVATTTGILLAVVGFAGPAALLYCAVPMLGIAWAFAYLNRLDPSAGATYSWVGRALHPILGFVAGWCCIVSVTLFMIAGSVPVASLTLSLFSQSLANNLTLVTLLGITWLVAIFCLVVFGVQVSARAQWIMCGIELVALGILGVFALVHISGHPHVSFSWSWLGVSHFHGLGGFAVGALVAAYWYWGWDVTANLSEETKNGRRAAGAGGLIGVAILIVVFEFYTIVIQMIIPSRTISDNTADILSVLAHDVWPAAGGKMIVAVVMLSSVATLETALIQSTRTVLVMADDKTMPSVLGRVHPSWRTPWVAATVLTAIAVGLFAASNFIGSVSKILNYAASAIGLQIAAYYGLAGIAVVVAYRKVVFRSFPNFIFIGLWPAIGGVFMLWIFGESIHTLSGTAVAIGLGAIGLGIVPLAYFWLKGSPALRRSRARPDFATLLALDESRLESAPLVAAGAAQEPSDPSVGSSSPPGRFAHRFRRRDEMSSAER